MNARPFQRRPRADIRPKFANPVPCVRCAGSCYVGDDHCIACEGWGEQEGPPAPRPTIPLTAVDSELVAALVGLWEAYLALREAFGRAASAARAANQGGMVRVLEQASHASRGAGLGDQILRLKQWADARLKVAGGP